MRLSAIDISNMDNKQLALVCLSVLLATCVFCTTTVGHGSWNGTPADLHDTLRLFVNVLLAVGHAIVSTH